MLSLCSCRPTSVLVSLSLNLAGKIPLRPPLSISSKNFLNSAKLNPSVRTMSAPPRSAFDVLMANSSKKKTPPQSQSPKPKGSSPRKRKSPSESKTPKLLPLSSDSSAPSSDHQEPVEKSSSGPIVDTPVENAANDGSKSLGLKQSETKTADKDEGTVAVKKAKVSISPDESVTELKKKAAEFNVKRAACWGEGERVPFMIVAKALHAVSEESGRIAMTHIVCNLLRTVMETSPDDLLAVMYLFANKIAPAHEGLELGIGEASIIKALGEACGAKESHIKKKYEVIKRFNIQVRLCATPFFYLNCDFRNKCNLVIRWSKSHRMQWSYWLQWMLLLLLIALVLFIDFV